MKIQSLAVIFSIIVLPIVIILSYYIHSEIDTIALQTAYDTKLIDSTHDAMAALEINTANEDLSSVADSLRSIIEASTNIFFNTLATNLGISNAGNASVDSYVPAILYTLYDGYYIYSPTRIPTICTYNEDSVVYVGDRGVSLIDKVSYINDGVTVNFGVYEFKKAEYGLEKDDDPSNNETEYARNARQGALYNELVTKSIQYEYGQMLYLNENGTYSTVAHTNPGDLESGYNTKYKQEHILKSYMPYSARYEGTKAGTTSGSADKYNLTINYTLDNYLTVEGNIGDVYYSKTGYLISSGTVFEAKADGEDLLSYNEKTAEEMILAGDKALSITIKPKMENGVQHAGIAIDYSPVYDETGDILTYAKAKERLDKLYELIYTKNEDGELADLENPEYIGEIQDLEYQIEQLSAIAYYVKAQIFSNWVYSNLNNIHASDIAEDVINLNESSFATESKLDLFHRFSEDETLIFDSGDDPERTDSKFYSHKVEVIKNNIQYNLNLAISVYNAMLQTRNVQMPVIKDSEWEQILTRVSVTSFMQGLQCGMKVYNNYAIASSTNNELTMLPTELYYVEKGKFNTADESHEYHKIDCDLLNDKKEDGSNNEFISFTSKDIKYDKIYDRATRLYSYNHRNLGCYRCAIPSNYKKDMYDKDGNKEDAEGNQIRGYSDDTIVSLLPQSKQKAYYVGIASARQEIYKTNAITDSNGYEVWDDVPKTNREFGSAVTITNSDSARSIKEIREIEVTVSNLKCYNESDEINESEAIVNFQLLLNGTEISTPSIVNLNQATPQTMIFKVHSDREDKVSNVGLKKIDLDSKVICDMLNIRIIYE